MSRYCLSDYTVTFGFSNSVLTSTFGDLKIGGQGSTTDSITVTKEQNLYSVNGYATGGYVHNKNLSKVGTVSLSINQLSNDTAKLSNLYKFYEQNDYAGFTITVKDKGLRTVAKCSDCYPSNQPERSMQSEAQNMTWEFTCGVIDFDQ